MPQILEELEELTRLIETKKLGPNLGFLANLRSKSRKSADNIDLAAQEAIDRVLDANEKSGLPYKWQVVDAVFIIIKSSRTDSSNVPGLLYTAWGKLMVSNYMDYPF